MPEEETNILDMIIKKESWEEVIYQIVSIENLDPWNIDLLNLTNRFIEYIDKIKELDFRIPAKIVFVAVVLLRLKSDYLSIFEEEKTFEEVAKAKPFPDLGIDPNLVKLGLPMKRMPKRQITLDELISALKKALVVREKKVERRRIWRAQLQANIDTEVDITNKISNVMKEIDVMMDKLHESKLKFSQIVENWNNEQIVGHFIPLLHLEQDKKVSTEQEEFFKEIFISRQSQEPSAGDGAVKEASSGSGADENKKVLPDH